MTAILMKWRQNLNVLICIFLTAENVKCTFHILISFCTFSWKVPIQLVCPFTQQISQTLGVWLLSSLFGLPNISFAVEKLLNFMQSRLLTSQATGLLFRTSLPVPAASSFAFCCCPVAGPTSRSPWETRIWDQSLTCNYRDFLVLFSPMNTGHLCQKLNGSMNSLLDPLLFCCF